MRFPGVLNPENIPSSMALNCCCSSCGRYYGGENAEEKALLCRIGDILGAQIAKKELRKMRL